MQTYSTKSTAVRGAKRAGLEKDQIVVAQATDGKWYWEEMVEEAAQERTLKSLEEYKVSIATNPVQLVRERCKQYFGKLTRKDLTLMLVNEGVAYQTARTQIQKYSKSLKG